MNKKNRNLRYRKSKKHVKKKLPKRKGLRKSRKKNVKYGGHINGNMNGAPLHPGIPNHHMPLTYKYNHLDNTDFADARLMDSGLVKVKVQ